MKRWKRGLAVFAVAAAIAMPTARHIWFGYRSPESSDQLYSSVKRKHYPFRHWQWSGIPPFEGGFISDPHYLWSEPASFPASVAKAFGIESGRYAVIDVNPFFDDSTSEILLAMDSDGTQVQYSLEYPRKERVQAVIAEPMPPSAMLFPYQDQVALLFNFSGSARGVCLLKTRLTSGQKLRSIPVSDPRFAQIALGLKQVLQDRTIRDQFCESRRKDFIAFYEKFGAACEVPSRTEREIEADFHDFWIKE